ncbi:MAG: DUF1080 domain-containing protein [Reichenbachiella sp.]
MKVNNIKILGKYYLCILVSTMLWSCEKNVSYDRPSDTWVFRSVLDERARMITAALNEEMWVAYDIQTAQMYKAWKGGVKLDGAVYTTSHGPQPTSLGYAYFTDEKSSWRLANGDDTLSLKSNYKGHSFDKGQLTLKYELIAKNRIISIQEVPEYEKRGNQNGLNRSFSVSGLNDGENLILKTSLTSLRSDKDYKTKGSEFNISAVRKDNFENGEVTVIEGVLVMSNGESSLLVFFHPGFDRIAPEMLRSELTEDGKEVHPGAKLIEKSDCHACHNTELKTIGPAYITVARKYMDNQKSIDMLTDKIISGGSGVWGDVPMVAHNALSNDEAAEMVKYILSLDDKESSGSWSKFMIGEKSRILSLEDKYSKGPGQGLFVNYYRLTERVDDVDEVIKNSDPIRNGPMENIHTWGNDFDISGDFFIVEYSGFIDIPKEDSYGFRLINNHHVQVYIDDQLLFNHLGENDFEELGSEMYLKSGKHRVKLIHQKAKHWSAVSLQWFNKEKEVYELIPDDQYSFDESNIRKTISYTPLSELVKSIPGDSRPVAGLHPAFDLFQARPNDFLPKVGGIDFLSNGDMVICTWDSVGPVYLIKNYMTGDPAQITAKLIASGLAEPLGLKVVDDEIYVLQKQELTRLVDTDGDEMIDEYQKVSDNWRVSANFHEFAFGLDYQDGFFYATLATAIMPGGASANPQIPDRGKVIKINKDNGSVTFMASGLRTPNGIGRGVDGGLFVADNQGDWLPASKIVEVTEGAWFGSRSVDFEGTDGMQETLPVVWLPQDEIGNSPSQPIAFSYGPYQNQMLHGEVTHGGLKRVYAERVEGKLQGAVFRFTQGLEAGVNRVSKAPDGSLMIGGVGNPGNWSHNENGWFGLQRMVYNGKPVFEMLKVSAKADGFEIEFTEAIKDGQQVKAEDFLVQQWYYLPTKNYGGPKLDLETLIPSKFSMSPDRKKVYITLEGMKENHLVYFRIISPFASSTDQELWTTEAWYTLNKIPGELLESIDYTLAHNTLTPDEITDGWKLLFDGKTWGHFRNYRKETIGKQWTVADEAFHFKGKKAIDKDWNSEDGGDVIITDKTYENYELYLEWKLQKNGNSGVIYNIIESEDYDYVWSTGPELQLLDNVGHGDGQIKMHRAGDLYDMISTKFVTVNEPEQWNRVKLIVNNGHVEHWLNGYKVVEYQLWTPEWDEMVAGSKFAEFPGFGTGRGGHIALQDHGDKVWFRNIKIKEL